MCHSITFALPADKKRLVRSVLGAELQATRTHNPDALAALPRGFAAMLLTDGHCSCSLYAPPPRKPEESPKEEGPKKGSPKEESPKARRPKDKRLPRSRGELKIERSFEPDGPERYQLPGASICPDVVRRLDALFLAAGGIAVFVHWYCDDVETEQLPLKLAPPCRGVDFAARVAKLGADELLIAGDDSQAELRDASARGQPRVIEARRDWDPYDQF